MPDDSICRSYKTAKIVRATEEHIAPIVEDMRDMDALEVKCMGATPTEALKLGLDRDQNTFTILDLEDTPIAMFGAGGIIGGAGYIWMLAANKLKLNKREFVKVSRSCVDHIIKPFTFCGNVVHTENEQAIRWLKFCGAYFIKEIKLDNQPFYEFVVINKAV